MKKKHIERLVASQYHDKGGCVVRHGAAQRDACKYAKNGYRVTSSSRKNFYNAPRYDAAEILEIQQEMVTRQRDGKTVTYRTPVHPGSGQENVWDVDKYDNFVPLYEGGDGGHYPYKHNWHHMIANDMLFQELYDPKKHEYKLLQLLMHGKYNLNGERNIVLLPKQAAIGEIIKWPCHPNNHPEYDRFAKNMLSWLKEKLLRALGNKDICEVDEDRAEAVAEDVNKVSDSLFRILERMPGGVHINSIQRLGADIDAKLRKEGVIK